MSTIASREQAAFARRERQRRNARILKVARENPDLTSEFIAERFGLGDDAVLQIISRAGGRRR